jgi:hypothetical protein
MMAIPFWGAVAGDALDRGPIRSNADAAHPGFVLRDETAAAEFISSTTGRRSIPRSPTSSCTSRRWEPPWR